MSIDPRIPLSVFANQPNFAESYGQALQLRSLLKRQKMEDMQLAEAQRVQAQQKGVRDAAAGAVTPAQTQQVQIPGLDMSQFGGTGTMPNRTDNLTTPPSFDRSKMLSNLAGNPQTASMVPQYQAQFAKEDAELAQHLQAIKSGQIKLSKDQADALTAHLGAVAQLAMPIKQLEDAGAPPQQIEPEYQKALAAAQQNGIDVSSYPPNYVPGIGNRVVQQGMAVKDALGASHAAQTAAETNRHNLVTEQPKPGVDVPFSPAVEAQKSRLRPQMSMGGADALEGPAVDVAARMYLQTGQLPPLGKDTALRAKILNRAAAISPDANVAENKQLYSSQSAVRKDFTSGQASKALTSFATASHHLDTLEAAADALDSGNLKALNSLANSYHVATGSTPIAAYKAIQQVVAGDVNKAIAASGTVAEGEMQIVRNAVDPSLSTAQKKAAINALRELMSQKRSALKAQYEQGMKGTPNFGESAPTHRFNPDTGKIEAINAQ